MPDTDIRPILDPLQVDPKLKAEAWDHFQGASSPEDFQARFANLNIPKEAKAALWDAKFAPAAPKGPSGPPISLTDPSKGNHPSAAEADQQATQQAKQYADSITKPELGKLPGVPKPVVPGLNGPRTGPAADTAAKLGINLDQDGTYSPLNAVTRTADYIGKTNFGNTARPGDQPAIDFSLMLPNADEMKAGGASVESRSVVEGVRGLTDLASQLTSFENVMVTKGAGDAAKAAQFASGGARLAYKGISAGFAAYFGTEMGKHLVETYPDLKTAVANEDWPTVTRMVTSSTGQAILVGLAGKHIKDTITSGSAQIGAAIDEHNTAAETQLKGEQQTGKDISNADSVGKTVLPEPIEIDLNGRKARIEAGSVRKAGGKAGKPAYQVIDSETGDVLHGGTAATVKDFLASKGAKPNVEAPIEAPPAIEQKVEAAARKGKAAEPVADAEPAETPEPTRKLEIHPDSPYAGDDPHELLAASVDELSARHKNLTDLESAIENNDFKPRQLKEAQKRLAYAKDAYEGMHEELVSHFGPEVAGLARTEIERKEPEATQEEKLAPEEKPAAKLPRDLAGAQPRYNHGSKAFTLDFADDADKAAYIAAQEKPSKRDADYLKFGMDATGLSEEDLRDRGRQIRAGIKGQAKDAEPGKLTVAKFPAEETDTPAIRTGTLPSVDDLAAIGEREVAALPSSPNARKPTKSEIQEAAQIVAKEHADAQQGKAEEQPVASGKGSEANPAGPREIADSGQEPGGGEVRQDQTPGGTSSEEGQPEAEGTKGVSDQSQRSGTDGGIAPSAVKPGTVAEIPIQDIHVDAPRFQFKANVGQGGAGEELRGVTKWDPEKAGITSVWQDPKDGKTYVVNGHHRLELAQRLGAKSITSRYLVAKTAKEARTKGALINIAEGRGESTDAAKVFRDSGLDAKGLEAEGVSLKGAKAKEGLALSKLSSGLFERVVSGEIPAARGAVVGEGLASHADQTALYTQVEKRERGGKRATNDQIEEMIRLANHGPKVATSSAQGGLFGGEEAEHSPIFERAEVSDYIRKQLAGEKRLFSTVGTAAVEKTLGRNGNVIKSEENSDIAQQAGRSIALYDKLSTHAGPVADAIDQGAKELANGEERSDAVKNRVYEAVREHLIRQGESLAGRNQGSGQRSEGDAQGRTDPARTGERDLARRVAEPSIQEQTKIALRNKDVPALRKIAAAQLAERKAKLDRPPVGSGNGGGLAGNRLAQVYEGAEEKLGKERSFFSRVLREPSKGSLTGYKTAAELLSEADGRFHARGATRPGVVWLNRPGAEILRQVLGEDEPEFAGVYLDSSDQALIAKLDRYAGRMPDPDARRGIERVADALRQAFLRDGDAIAVVGREMKGVRRLDAAVLTRRHEAWHRAMQSLGIDSAEFSAEPLVRGGLDRLGSSGEYLRLGREPGWFEVPAYIAAGQWQRLGYDLQQAAEVFSRYLDLLERKHGQAGIDRALEAAHYRIRSAIHGRQSGTAGSSAIQSLRQRGRGLEELPDSTASGESVPGGRRGSVARGTGETEPGPERGFETSGRPERSNLRLFDADPSQQVAQESDRAKLQAGRLKEVLYEARRRSTIRYASDQTDRSPGEGKKGGPVQRAIRERVSGRHPDQEPEGNGRLFDSPEGSHDLAAEAKRKLTGDQLTAEFRSPLNRNNLRTKLKPGAQPAQNSLFEATPEAPQGSLFSRFVKDESGTFTPGKLGVDQLVNGDIVPGLKTVAAGLRAAKDDILSVFAPAARGPLAHSGAMIVRERAADLAQRTDRAQAALEQARKYFDSRTPDQNHDFMNRVEEGRAQGNLHEESMARIMRDLLKGRREEVQALGKGQLRNYYENYFPHMWADPKAAAAVIQKFFKQKMEGSKAFLEQRSIPTIKYGLDAGLKLASDNPVELVLMKTREMDKFIMANLTLGDMESKGLAQFVHVSDTVPEGWARIDDPIAAVYGKPTDEGEIVIKGHYYAPEPAARVLNNYLSPGMREKSAAFRAYLGVGNALNQFQLGWSAFHLTFTSVDAATSKLALGIYQASHGAPLQGLKSALSSPAAPFTNAMLGDKVLKEWYNPGTQGARFAKIVDAMILAGGRAGMDSFYKTSITKNMLKAWRSGNVWGAAFRSPFAINEQAARPILEWLVPRQKMGVFADLAEFEMSRLGPDADPGELQTALARAWDSVDNRMGQLVYDNLFWDKMAKDLAMASVRSVGWNIGTLRELGGGAADFAKEGKKLAGGGKPEMTPRMSYVIALPIVVGAIGGILTYLWTGKHPEGLKDYFFPKDRRGKRWNVASYMKDVHSYATDPVRTVKNKVHPLLSMILEMLENKDFYGHEIRNPDHPVVKQALEELKHMGSAAEPMAMRGLLDKRHASDSAADKALPFFGVTRAPADVQDGYSPRRRRR